MTVGLVIVSHSARLAGGVAELAEQMAQGKVAIAAAGGTADGALGTSVEKILEALHAVDGPDGILVLLEKRRHTIGVLNVELRKAKAALGSKPREVGVGSRARQIVDDDNVVSVPEMTRCGVGPDESGTARDDHFPIVETLYLSLGFHNCGSLSLVVVYISLFASELRVLESRPSVTDRNLERIASLLAVPTILPRSFPSTKYSSVGIN